MIGSREEAEVLAEWEHEYYDDGTFDWIPPGDGWEFIGEGAERIVWRAPSGIIYKVEQDGEQGANYCEIENIARLSEIECPGWRVPVAAIYEFAHCEILAMEYVQGVQERTCLGYLGRVCLCKGRCIHDIAQDMAMTWSITDGHTGNYMVESDGTRVLVDVTG